MQILNKSVCAKCGETAICLISGLWICGKCLIEYENKLKELKQKAILEVTG